MSPFQGAHSTPHSWVIAKALVYWLTEGARIKDSTTATIQENDKVFDKVCQNILNFILYINLYFTDLIQTLVISYRGWGHFGPACWGWGWAFQWRSSASVALWKATAGATERTRKTHSSWNSPLNNHNHMKSDVTFIEHFAASFKKSFFSFSFFFFYSVNLWKNTEILYC